MKSLLSLLTCLTLVTGASGADITVRLSVKAVLDPATGMRQTNVNEATFSNSVVAVNAMLDSYGRGYRYAWDGVLHNVGGLGQYASGPSQYYDVNFHDPANSDLKDQMEDDAKANPGAFQWSTTALNIYIVRYGGANWNVCSFPGNDIVLLNGAAGFSTPATVLHETSHYFNLNHTFNGEQYKNADNSTCTNNNCSCALIIPGGDDDVPDTILDAICWASQDDIAQGNYGKPYANLNLSGQASVDRIWNNIMSYHIRQNTNITLLTTDQLDRWTDSANDDRANVCTGHTWFVDRTSGSSDGTSANPFATFGQGITSAKASGGDIVLVRPGHYNEPQTISKPVVLRATRGSALIGEP
jgi:hypothetical protein